MKRRKLLFLATEDWFVRSHFAPLVRRACNDDFEVVIAARRSGSDFGDARVVDMPFARGSMRLLDLRREVRALRDLLNKEQPHIVHAIALKPIALCLFAGEGVPQALALTGRGYLAASGKWWTKFVLAVLARRVRRAVTTKRAVLLVENVSDRRWIEGGEPLPDARVFLMPGAGVDPETFKPAPEPAGPVVIGVVARLVRSKGIDLAVEAVRQLRRSGLEVSLQIAGAVDSDNPERVSDQEIADWRRDAGVALMGRVDDVAGFWAQTHIACLPSRGGEGLPRSLLEAASCARPIVTTDVPGCADFVRSGRTGLVVKQGDVAALTESLRALVEDVALRRRMGAAGRELVLAAYTEDHAAARAAEAWRSL